MRGQEGRGHLEIICCSLALDGLRTQGKTNPATRTPTVQTEALLTVREMIVVIDVLKSREYTTEDGTRVSLYTKGTRKETFSDGDSVIHFTNGDHKQASAEMSSIKR